MRFGKKNKSSVKKEKASLKFLFLQSVAVTVDSSHPVLKATSLEEGHRQFSLSSSVENFVGLTTNTLAPMSPQTRTDCPQGTQRTVDQGCQKDDER
ncbi:hypothetical protein PoB_001702500 [Plakobranchus ocellatus]|uniref:Uncharacterized protein n=1 Tax=Plakobranchus ocellatus TaxID=259542 RepID=A0AAV3Z7H3_9GAST|nr:hypothetical protein PoB_001702500 [Plakobranchus ocellatus]